MCIIEHNTCSGSDDEHGIYFSNSADDPIIRYNHCFDNNANGIHMNGDASLGGDGVISNAQVYGNVIHGNGSGGGSGINCDGVINSVIYNNLLYDNHASGISLYQIDGGAPSTGNKVYNNTIINASDAPLVREHHRALHGQPGAQQHPHQPAPLARQHRDRRRMRSPGS